MSPSQASNGDGPGANANARQPALTGSAAILARIRAERSRSAADKSNKKNLVVLYASQTGTSQEIARSIQAEAARRGVKSEVASMNEFGFESITPERAPILVVVASSTGDGDPPDNCAKTLVRMRRAQAQKSRVLEGVQFTLLGLGDSNYTRFMHIPRVIMKGLAQLGATCFYNCGEADEVDGLEMFVDVWMDKLWPALLEVVNGSNLSATPGRTLSKEEPEREAAKLALALDAEGMVVDGFELVGTTALAECRVDLRLETGAAACEAAAARESALPSADDLQYRDAEGSYSPDRPFWAKVNDARYLTASWSDRKVLHLELDVEGAGMQYHPGDAIGVLAGNDPQLVDRLLERLGVDGSHVLQEVQPLAGVAASGTGRLLPHLRWPCTLQHAFTYGVDITSLPRKSLLRLLAEHCSDARHRRTLLHLSSRGGRDAYKQQVEAAKQSLFRLLQRFPTCHPPLPALLDALPALAPRMYSLTTSPLQHPNCMQIALSIVNTPLPDGSMLSGVATNWLDRLAQPMLACDGGSPAAASVRVPIYLRKGGDFKPPSDLSVPMIMIGPGTGVVPFRGFLQHHQQLLASAPAGTPHGESWLFFGCRRSDEDYLYRTDLEAFSNDGTLTELQLAFSREQDHKVYVQHRMAEHGARLADLIVNRGAVVLVCGDGVAMAKDVHACLEKILVEHAGKTPSESIAMLAAMARNQRYVRDIWA